MVPHVAMANLIAGKRVVPELIQKDFTAANIVQQLEPLLPDGPARASMMLELQAIRVALAARQAPSVTRPGETETRRGAIDRVAAVILEELGMVAPEARGAALGSAGSAGRRG
jgi:lipid-A-disaccharide synthase